MRAPRDRDTPADDHFVEMSLCGAVTKRAAISYGIAADIVETTSHERSTFRFRGPKHLLVVYEQGLRQEGDTFVEGLSRSRLRNLERKLTFVPAGHEYREWLQPRAPARLMFVHFDPARLHLSGCADTAAAVPARLFFEDATLRDTALKLKKSLEGPSLGNRLYLEALGIVLAHELACIGKAAPTGETRMRGGLAPWQQRIVTAYIDTRVAESIPLATLAQLARLSPYHFCRAFKQTFGVPPHRYHTNRRIEHAKALLATRAHSVTEIGLTVGYNETSSFTAAFRKAAGLTPSAYQRSLE